MSRRSRRILSPEESWLWAEISRSIVPLPGRRAPDPLPEASPAAGSQARSVPAGPTPPPPPAPIRAPALPPLAPLERRMTRALARGRARAEGTLDLHGLTQAEAHERLLGFIRRSHGAGLGLVLVITGRGGGEGRGVLRRMVPHWLGLPGLRQVVLGFQEAGTRQGGAGALYVRLRRRREA